MLLAAIGGAFGDDRARSEMKKFEKLLIAVSKHQELPKEDIKANRRELVKALAAIGAQSK